MHPAVSRGLFESAVGRLPPDLAPKRLWTFHQLAYPIVDCQFDKPDRTSMRLRMDFTEWDDLPPSITLHAADGTPQTSLMPNPTNVFNAGPHPSLRRPFICMAGSREFHSHTSHINEKWDQYRGKPGFDVFEILHKLWQAWLKGTG